MSELPTLRDARAGQEALFTPPLALAIQAHLLCHNCGELVPHGRERCPECGAYQREAAKREAVERETITIQLADCAGPDDPPMNARLKRAIKALGRAYKLRVISMEAK